MNWISNHWLLLAGLLLCVIGNWRLMPRAGRRATIPSAAIAVAGLALLVLSLHPGTWSNDSNLTETILFSIFLLALGKSPLAFFGLVWTGGFGSAFSIQNTLQRAAPLILTGLAFAIPARIGLTLIGAEGALVLGGFSAAAVAIPLVTGSWPAIIGLPINSEALRRPCRAAAGFT